MQKFVLKSLAITFIMLTSTSLLSCASDEDTTNQSTIQCMQFDSYFENSRNLYSQGNSYYYTLRGEKGALQATNQRDKNIKRINVLDELIAAMDDIDEGYERIIKSIHEEKSKILAAIGTQSALSNLDPSAIYPVRIDAKKITQDKEDYFHTGIVLESVIRYRDALVKICANSHFRFVGQKLERDVSHSIGQISRIQLKGDESDSKYFRQLLEKVHLDDKETLFEILISLTPRLGEKQKFSAQQALHFLCIQESRILAARKTAMGLIKSSISIDGYRFDKILPLAYGPSSAESGQEVEIKILMAAFDSENNPEVTCVQDGIIEVNHGVATLRAKVHQTTTFSGTIAILNKAGARKTREWEVTIPVLND